MKKIPTVILVMLLIAYSSFVVSNDELKESIKRGETIYALHCTNCHMSEGEGLKGAFPPLAKSDYLMADKHRSIRIILQGIQGKIMVNEVEDQMPMPPLVYLSDEHIRDVLNYVRNSWGNEGEEVSLKEVVKMREKVIAEKNQ